MALIFTKVMSEEKYNAVVISGGGIKGISSLGALHYEYEKGKYDPDHTKIYAGTSIGAVISLLLVCGYKPMEIFTELYKMENFFDVGSFYSIWDAFKHMGLMSISSFTNKIETLVKSKMGDIPTLLELKKRTGKTLVVTGANITKTKCEYYTHKTRPRLGCVDAVKMSSNLPLIFQRIKYDDCYIADGGMIDNFPLKYIDDKKMKILGIVTTGMEPALIDNQQMGYFMRLIVMPINANTELRCQLAGANTKLIKMKINSNMMAFALSSEEKMNMFVRGFSDAESIDNTIKIFVRGWKDTIHSLLSGEDSSSDSSLDETTNDGWNTDW